MVRIHHGSTVHNGRSLPPPGLGATAESGDLVAAARLGEGEACGGLYRRYVCRVCGVVLARTGDRAVAQGLTGETPAFYTVREAARILRVDPATVYRAIREDALPAVRIRTRYVVPAAALHQLVTEVAQSGGCIDVARLAAERRTAREIEWLSGGAR
jgi:excisionase family DNA binding protein